MANDSIEAFTIQAEDIIYSGFITEGQEIAEEGNVASLFQSGATQGELRYIYTGAAGAYDLTITTFDENDGQGSFDVLVNGELVFSYTLDEQLGSGGVSLANKVDVLVQNLELETGDVVSVVANSEASEWMRIDSLTFTPFDENAPQPALPVFTIEAEDMIADGYSEEGDHAVASGNAVVGLYNSGDPQESGTLTYTFDQTAGAYDLVLTAHDEHDGEGAIEVRVNGELLGTLTLDQFTTPDYPITAANRVTLTLEGVELAEGDVVEITGYADAGEWVRIDKLDFFDAEPAEPDNIAPVAVDDEIVFPTGVTEFLVNEFTDGSQSRPTITALADGQFVITWQSGVAQQGDDSGFGVKAQIFNADGSVAVSEFLVNEFTDGQQTRPSVTALTDGRFVVTWQSDDMLQGDDSKTGIKARVFNADGTEAVSEFLVNEFTTRGQHNSQVTSLADGGFVITWTSDDRQQGDTSSSAIKARVFNADGTEAASEFLVNALTNGIQTAQTVTALDNGGFVVTWRSFDPQQGDDSGNGVKARIFNADGTEAVAEFLVNDFTDGDQHSISISTLANGGFVIAWRSNDPQQGDESGSGIKARIFNADGTEAVAEFLVNEITETNQTTPSVTTLADGRFIVTWLSSDMQQGDESGYAVKARIFNADGTESVSEFLVNEFTNSYQLFPNIEALEDGGFIATWFSHDPQQGDESGYGVKARMFNADGTPRENQVNAPEDEITSIDVATLLANDSDEDADELTISEVSATSANGAAITLNNDGTISYDPTNASAIQALNAGETLTDTFTYTVSDGKGGEDAATVSITIDGAVEPPNTAPFGDQSDIAMTIGEPVVIDLNVVFTDSENNPMTFSLDGAGAAAASIDGSVLTISPDAEGDYVLSVTANDGELDSQPVEFTVTAEEAPNTAPTGDQSDIAMTIGEPVVIDLDTIFTDAEGDALTYNIDGAGAAAASIDGSILTISPDAEGDYVLSVTANDGELDSQPVEFTVTAEAAPPNNAPVGEATAVLTGMEDVPTTFTLAELLEGFSDPDGDTLAIEGLSASAGQLVDNGGGAWTLTPPAEFVGQIDLTYSVVDGNGGVLPASIQLDVAVAPVAPDHTVEAEDMVAVGYSLEAGQSVASGNAVMGLYNGGDPQESGTLTYTFNQTSGTYDLVLTAHDEHDGAGSIEVRINGELVGSLALDQYTTPDQPVTDNNRVTLNLEGVVLAEGDVIEITGYSEGGEWARVDKLDFYAAEDVQFPAQAADDFLTGALVPDSIMPASLGGQQEILSLADGGYVVVWNERTIDGEEIEIDVKAQVFNADGTSQTNIFSINASNLNNKSLQDVAQLENGDIAVAWTEGSAPPYELKFAIYATDGSPVGNQSSIEVNSGDNYFDANIVAFEDGGFAVSFGTMIAGENEYRAAFYTSSGAPVSGEVLLGSENTLSESSDFISIGNNTALFVYHGFDETSQTNTLLAKIIDQAGNEVVSEFQVNELSGLSLVGSTESGANAAVLPDGRFIVTWTSSNAELADDSGASISARVFNADGTPATSEFEVNETHLGDQIRPDVSALSDGRIVFSWSDATHNDDHFNEGDARARVFNSDGTPSSSEIQVSDNPGLVYIRPEIEALDNGGFGVVLRGYLATDNSTWSTFVRFFDADGDSMVSAYSSEDDIVTLDTADLLANDSGDAITVTAVALTSDNGATLTLNGDGTITYDPTSAADIQALNDGEMLTDCFSYTVTDENGGEDTATVHIVVGGAAEPAQPSNNGISLKADISGGAYVLTGESYDAPAPFVAIAPEPEQQVGGATHAFDEFIDSMEPVVPDGFMEDQFFLN